MTIEIKKAYAIRKHYSENHEKIIKNLNCLKEELSQFQDAMWDANRVENSKKWARILFESYYEISFCSLDKLLILSGECNKVIHIIPKETNMAIKKELNKIENSIKNFITTIHIMEQLISGAWSWVMWRRAAKRCQCFKYTEYEFTDCGHLRYIERIVNNSLKANKIQEENNAFLEAMGYIGLIF